MGKRIIFCFDGTCNEPEDGRQSEGWLSGEPKDDNVTNIVKLHLMFGGDFEQRSRFRDQVSRYYAGVGTYGNLINRIQNMVFAPQNEDVGDIINRAMDDLKKLYKPDDRLYLFGFSRGAAIARVFAARLKKYFPKAAPKVAFLGVFDTVASFDKPNLDDHKKPVSDVIFKDANISPTVQQAVHLLAIDEKRIAFQPLLMNAQEGRDVQEIWFAGAHSDVGGGYRYDGLADNTLQFMINEILKPERGLDLKLLSPLQIHYDKLSSNKDIEIDYDDIVIHPNPYGFSHQQKRPPFLTRVTLADRDVRININNKKSRIPPVVHPSVVQRIMTDSEYKPASLRNKIHRLWHEQGVEDTTYKGYHEHKMVGGKVVKPLPGGEERSVTVYANTKHNRSGLLLEAGARYVFTIPPNQVWFDSGIKTGAKGWSRKTEELGVKEIFIKLAEGKRRHPQANWFELIGQEGKEGEPFRILQHTAQSKPYTAKKDAELVCFANDLDRFYDNNLGSLQVKVQRLPEVD